jgi:hypothetical protein
MVLLRVLPLISISDIDIRYHSSRLPMQQQLRPVVKISQKEIWGRLGDRKPARCAYQKLELLGMGQICRAKAADRPS